MLCGCHVDVELGEECPIGEPACAMAAAASPVSSSADAPQELPTTPTPASSASPPLHVEIRHADVARQQLALTCGEPCVDLTASASGGVPPYAFRWEDGSMLATRRVCPLATSHYQVRVTDQSGAVGQLADMFTAAAFADFTAEVPDCSPSPPTMGPMSPVSPMPAVPDGATAPDADDPDACLPIFPEFAPREGFFTGECDARYRLLFFRPIRAGALQALQAIGRAPVLGTWRVELWGTTDGCRLDEKLLEFPVAGSPVNTRVTFSSQRSYLFLALEAIRVTDANMWPPFLEFSMCR
jgi:hypothetical protein